MTNDLLCWLLLAAIFIIIEIISLGLTSIWFAGAAFIAAIAALFGANMLTQIILFIAVSVVLFIFTRPIAQKYLNVHTEKTNAEGLVGQSAFVLTEINNVTAVGLVKVNGMEWSARASEDSMIIEPGITVTITDLQGNKLIVKKQDTE